MSATSWPSRTAQTGAPPAASGAADAQCLTAVDHPDQRIVASTVSAHPMYLRLDDTHELPLVLLSTRGAVVARFADAFEAALYLHARDAVARSGLPRVTLPLPIAEAFERSSAARPSLERVATLRNGGAL